MIQPLVIEEQKTSPLPLQRALWHFLLAGLAVRLSIHYFLPFLSAQGLTPFESFVVSTILPVTVLFALAFGSIKAENTPMTLPAFIARFRLQRLTWRQLGWIGLGFMTAVAGTVLLTPTQGWLLELFPALQPPTSFPPLMNPTLQSAQWPAVTAVWMGTEAVGNWGYAALVLLLFFFNIFGEELYWRGVLLPRQELVHGRTTWLIHGLMWHLFHLPIYPWYLLAGLPLTLTISFVAHKTGNTWTTIILHGLANFTTYLLMIGVVVGVV